jgi:RNA polymerase sigma factor (TIGR02999 family)
MADPSQQEVTQLLQAWSNGEREALEQLTPLVQAELHRLAERYMRGEQSGHTLQATALVNEAYIRLIDWKNVRWQNRAHFFGVAAQLMRRILIDYARSRPSCREGKAKQVSLDEALTISEEKASELLALDDALTALKYIDPRKCRIVEMRYFGGLSEEEIAEVLVLSTRTVIREWNKARAWLRCEMNKD